MINIVQSILSTCIEFSTADKATIISGALPAFATICGFVITVIVWNNNVKTRRADYISDLLDRLHNDPLIKDLKEKKIIRKKEFNLFKSMINHAASNKSTLRYFYNLRHYSKVYSSKVTTKAKHSSKRTNKKFTESFTFKYLFDYIKKHKYIDMEKFSKADLTDEIYYQILKRT